MKQIAVLVALLVAAAAISIPVSSTAEKCMIVYSMDPEDYLKIDIKFDRFPSQAEKEYYLIRLYNTETNQAESFNITDGIFRREIQLTQHVVYRLCMKIVLNRYGSSEVQKNVEYESGVRHRVDADAKVEIPDNLLKIKDLQGTYSELIGLIRVIKQTNSEASSFHNEQDDLFKQQASKIKSIEWITILEFIAISAFGVYQYFRLRNVIDAKQRG